MKKTLTDWLAEPWSLREWADLCNLGRAAGAIVDALKADDIELSALSEQIWLDQQKIQRRQHWFAHVTDSKVAEALSRALADPPHPFAVFLEASPLRHSASLAALVQEHFIFVRR